MPRGPYPLLLTLAITLSGRVDAVGLGDIHVDSALNEPLSAQIEIVGASAEDLVELKAAVADRETFQRYGAEYPAFLSTANFKVARDPEGRPILAVHSDQAFTEPLVSLLVDLRWRHGKLIREYSLLLDPAGMADTHRAAELAAADTEDAPLPETPPAAAAKVAAVTQRVEPETAPAAVPHDVRAQGTIAHHRITGKDTLRGIVRRAGARSESTVQRMMIAIFRANPSAFEGNINRLRKGATLTCRERKHGRPFPLPMRAVRCRFKWRRGTTPLRVSARLAPRRLSRSPIRHWRRRSRMNPRPRSISECRLSSKRSAT